MTGFFGQQAASNWPQTVSDSTCASECVLSPRADRPKAPPFCSSLREGTSLAALTAAVPPTTIQHTLGGHIVSAGVHASQVSFTADYNHAPHLFYAYGIEPSKSEPGLDVMHLPDSQIGVNQVPCAGHGVTYDTLNRYGSADEVPLSSGILHDADLLVSELLDEWVIYKENLTDMIRLNGILIRESEIVCRQGACGHRFKVKETKSHLVSKHGFKSNSKSYKCFWPECVSREPLTQLSSLVRHVRECHGSVYWHCPICEDRFTRNETLLKHFSKCSGHSKPLQGGIAYGQSFAYEPHSHSHI